MMLQEENSAGDLMGQIKVQTEAHQTHCLHSAAGGV